MTREEVLAALQARAETPGAAILLIPCSPQVLEALIRGTFITESGKKVRMVGGRLDGLVFEPSFSNVEE